jgi:hypothetical protein
MYNIILYNINNLVMYYTVYSISYTTPCRQYDIEYDIVLVTATLFISFADNRRYYTDL